MLEQIQNGLPISENPFADIAEKIGAEVEEVVRIINGWKQKGIVRRVGAVVNHFKAGWTAGAMVVWQVEQERVDIVGSIFAGFDEVSHAYERQISTHWPCNVYTMVHGKDSESVKETVKKMSRAAGVDKYKVLETIKELKKVPPTYIYPTKSAASAKSAKSPDRFKADTDSQKITRERK